VGFIWLWAVGCCMRIVGGRLSGYSAVIILSGDKSVI
jgi:hypothetical protein